MKLFIKKFVCKAPREGADTWWVYLAKDGKGLAVDALFTYSDARKVMARLHTNGSNEEELLTVHQRISNQHFEQRSHNGLFVQAVVVNE